MYKLLAIIIALTALTAQAESTPKTPYYASIKADEANVRTGPSVRYPIQWVYTKNDWPVEVTATFERWRKIRDIYGEAGWIHESLISRKRSVVIKADGVQEIYRLPIPTSAAILIAENGVIAELLSCKSGWCKVNISDEKGWVESKHLWGVDGDEVF